MKNLGTSLRRGVKIMKITYLFNRLLKLLKSIRKTSEHHCGEGCNTNNLSKYLKLISLYAFGLKTAPASQLEQE